MDQIMDDTCDDCGHLYNVYMCNSEECKMDRCKCTCTEPNSCYNNPECCCFINPRIERKGGYGCNDCDCRGCYGKTNLKVGDRVETNECKNEFGTIVSVPTNNSYDVMVLIDGKQKPERQAYHKYLDLVGVIKPYGMKQQSNVESKSYGYFSIVKKFMGKFFK